jgi:hypothetical protein
MKTSLPVVLGMLVLVSAVWADGATGPGPAALEKAPGCCADSRCASACKVCVPEWTTKKTEKVAYGCKCVDFCLPNCFWIHRECRDGCCQDPNCKVCAAKRGACSECGGAGCIKCGRVRTRKVLIKKVHVTEVEQLDCVPKTVCGK